MSTDDEERIPFHLLSPPIHSPKYFNTIGVATWLSFWLVGGLLFSIPLVRNFLPVLGYSMTAINKVAFFSWGVFFLSIAAGYALQKLRPIEKFQARLRR